MIIAILLSIQALTYVILISTWPATRRPAVGVGFGLMAVACVTFRSVANTFLFNAVCGIWLVACALCIVFSIPLFLFKGVQRARSGPADPTRRRFLRGAALPAAAVSVSTFGNLNGLRRFELRHEDVALQGLPKALDGFRIGQITDSHVGPFISPEDIKRAVEVLDEAQVHLLTMTGDLIDDMTQLTPTLMALESSKAVHGILCILGNHEKWHGIEAVLRAYEESAQRAGNVQLLVDASKRLEHNGAVLRVVGVDYPMAPSGKHNASRPERNAMMQVSAQKAFAQSHPNETVLCLSHHPDFFPIAVERGARLTLAGHTHGGQVGFFRQPIFTFAFDYMLGRYEKQGAHLYVSAGTGHWLPFRLGIPTEITVLTLRAV